METRGKQGKGTHAAHTRNGAQGASTLEGTQIGGGQGRELARGGKLRNKGRMVNGEEEGSRSTEENNRREKKKDKNKGKEMGREENRGNSKSGKEWGKDRSAQTPPPLTAAPHALLGS